MNGDPKVKRFENYELLRQNGDIQVSDAEMEKLLANEAERKSFHQYIGNQYGNAGSFEEWEAAWFPEYSKKKDYGAGREPSTASSSATEPTPAASAAGVMGQQVTPKGILEAQGVILGPHPKAPKEGIEPGTIQDILEEQIFRYEPGPIKPKPAQPERLEGLDAFITTESMAPNFLGQAAFFDDLVLARQQDYIKALQNVPSDVLKDPSRAFDLIAMDDSARALHNDPNTSDYMRGQIKARTFSNAMDLVSGRLSLIEQGLDEAVMDRYSDAKAALIEIYESGDPGTQVGGRSAQDWLNDYEMLLQSDPALAEYDALNGKLYDLSRAYENIKGVNPAYYKEAEKQAQRQAESDLSFRLEYNGVLKYPRLVGVAAAAQAKSWVQGFMGFVASVGNSYENAAQKYNWADKWAETAVRMDWGHGAVIPSFAQRDIFTSTAKVGNYQVDIDTKGQPVTVRDNGGYVVSDEELKEQVIDQYLSAPDKYDPRFRPHLAPAVNTAVQGLTQILITSRFAGLGRTAAAAKGFAAGALTAQIAGQTYLQALEEFGPENADVAARFSIAVAAAQSAVSMYINPLEIKLNPRFNVSPSTLRSIARDLLSGRTRDAVIRNGFRAYSKDMARALANYVKESGKEGLEGLMEYAVDIAGRSIVRSVTDINAEYDASLNAAFQAFTSEFVGSSLAAALIVSADSPEWQKESMLIALEHKDVILPMVEKMHGADIAAKLKMAIDAADKRMRGQKLTREQKNEIVIQEYNKIIKGDEEEAASAPTTSVESVVQADEEPQVQTDDQEPQEVAVTERQAPTIYDIAREEALATRLEYDDTFYGPDGTQYTVVGEGTETVRIRNEDNGQVTTRSKAELRQEIVNRYNQAYTTAFPDMDFNQIASIRRGMWEQASQGVLGLPSPAPVAAQPSQDVAGATIQQGLDAGLTNEVISRAVGIANEPGVTSMEVMKQPDRGDFTIKVTKEDGSTVEKVFAYTGRMVRTRNQTPPTQTIAPEAQAPALAPAPTTETQAAQAEPQVAAETVPPVAPLVYNRATIEQAEGIDTEVIATALDVVSEIVPDMQVQVFETQAEMEATLGQRGNAFVSQDGKTIYISKESNAIDVQHEVIHPIMVAAELRNPGTIELFYDQIMNKLPERVRDDLEVFQLGYAEKSRQEQREEVVVEFLARLASGQYEMTVFKQEGVLDAIIGWFDAIFVKLGLTNPPNNLTDIKSFSRKIVEAFRTRAAVTFDTGVEAEIEAEMEAQKDLKSRFTESDLTGIFEDAGYHGGNLSEKSDYLEPGYRGQQPFTGYYFYSKPADAIERGNRKTGEKDVRVVDFSKYRLLKPTTVQYWAIDAGLKKIEDILRDGKLPSRERSDVMSRFKDSAPTVYNEIIGIESRLPILFQQWRKQLEKGGKVERFETVLLKELGYEGVDVRGLTEAAGLANPDSRYQGSVIFDLKPGTVYDPVIGKLDDGTQVKARFTQASLDPQYFRAKKWMRDEMNNTTPRLRDDIINDAMGIFGINRGQAEIMYDVLWRSPDRKRMLMPPGVQTNRTGIVGALDKAQQWRNEWLLKSQGMPMEVLRGLEGALGENELLVRRMMQSYGRIMKIIDSQPKDQRRDLRDTANRFLDGRITDAQISSLPSPLYAELRQMRAWIDEVSAEILNDANMSEMRTEIIGANMGEYVGRFFRVHLFGKYKPETASIKKFMDEYRRRNYEAVSIANPTWTADQIEAHLRYKGEQAYKDLLQKHAIDTKTGGQRSNKISKPTGMMKERAQLPKRAGDLWEAIDEQRWGPIMLPPTTGPVAGTGNPEFEAAFNAAWNDMRQYRLREAYFKHPQISSQFTAMEKAGVKLTQLLNSMGLVAPGTTPFSKENIRMAVENSAPMTIPPLPPTATPTQVAEYNKQVAIINDGVTEIAGRVRDRVNLDMDTIMANKNELDGTDGFRDLEHLTPGVRAILGEIPPLEATVLTMANIARYYTMNKYYRMIRALGEGNFLFRADDPNRPTWVNKRIPGREQDVGMVPPDATTEKMAPLSGLYTTPEIYDILMNVDTFNSVVDSAFGMRPLYKFTGKVQEWKTIFSPQTQSRNFLSNTIFVVRNGWADPFRTAFALAYVPADMLLLRFTGKRLSHQEVGKLAPLKRMSDAFMYSLNQNFGDPTWFNKWVLGVKTVSGSNISQQLDPNKYGFNPTVASDLSSFQNAKREMLAGMKKQETRAALVNDAVTNYGMSEDNARRLYADLQPKTFQDEMSDVLNKLSANGVLGTNLNMRIIQDYMGQMDTADKAVAYVTNHLIYEDASYFHRMGKNLGNFRKDVNKFFADAYSFGDDTFKIFGYLQERADYSNLLFGKEYFLLGEQQQAEVDAIAMENVKNIIPNYDRIGKLGKYFSRSLIFAQFIAFKIESMRTWGNLFLLGVKEVMDGKKSGNAAMVRHGYKRLASHVGMTLTTKAIQVSLAYGLGNSIRQILGDYILMWMDDEDDKEKQAMLRDPLPDYMKNDMLAASQPDNGKVTYISISANHPFGDFQRMMNEWAIPEAGNIYTQPSEMQIAALAAREMVEQFWGVKIGPNVLIEMFTNKDNYDRPIYIEATKDSPGDDFGVWVRKLASYAARRAGPGYISQLQRLGAWDVLFNALGLPENELIADFRKPVHAADWQYELLAMTSGYKPMTIDFYDQFKRRVGDFANYPGTQDEIYKKAQHWNLRIGDATFEEQIKRMVEEEYYTLASLHDAYRLPVKYGIVEASKMDEILTNKRDQGGVGLSGNLYNRDGSINNNGRLTHMIAYGTYSAPWDKIIDIVAKRQAKKPDYQYTQELDQWIKEFEMDKQ